MPAPVSPGTVIAGCRIEALVGEGATGSVYLAEESGTGRRVALKLLAPELACDDRFRQRFLRETGIAATLEHPNIVATLASGEENGLLYLAMPYVEGVDLRDLLRRQAPLETAVAVDLVAQVAAALDAAHDADLVHRDVKPGNILVAASGEETRAYLCDFGLARHVTSASSLTGDRGFVGTIDYVSPEQIRGAGVGAPADVYSLGCVLFECLTGDRPFERESELAVVFAHLNEEPPRVTELRPELPAAFDAVVATALSKSPEGRYESCGDLARAARGALRGATLRPRRSARTRIPVAVALALGATAVAFGLWSLVGGERGGGRPPAAVPRVLRPNTLNLVRARTGRLVARIGYGAGASAAPPGVDVGFSARSAWVLLLGDARLVRVDLATRKRTGAVLLPWRPAGIVTGGG